MMNMKISKAIKINSLSKKCFSHKPLIKFLGKNRGSPNKINENFIHSNQLSSSTSQVNNHTLQKSETVNANLNPREYHPYRLNVGNKLYHDFLANFAKVQTDSDIARSEIDKEEDERIKYGGDLDIQDWAKIKLKNVKI